MADFTIKRYLKLLHLLQEQGFGFSTVTQFYLQPSENTVILRHDVDRFPENSLKFAQILTSRSLNGTFYFRACDIYSKPEVISQICDLGHEVGYHYEVMTTAFRNCQGVNDEKKLASIAFDLFLEHLSQLKKICQVMTICMHGSPISKWDSRLIWKYHDYREHGIVCEPYFDIVFDNVLYLTDTGRRWDGASFSVRDKFLRTQGYQDPAARTTARNSINGNYFDWVVQPNKGSLMCVSEEGTEFQSRYIYRTTDNLISAIKNGSFPSRTMMTFHPQRWHEDTLLWLKELVFQNVKNIGKWVLLRL